MAASATQHDSARNFENSRLVVDVKEETDEAFMKDHPFSFSLCRNAVSRIDSIPEQHS
jgi:hypothetical protein